MDEKNPVHYESLIIVRKTRREDIDELVQVAKAGYGSPTMGPTHEKYESHLTIFPEGQLCVEYDGKLIGSCSSLIVNIEDYGKNHTFNEIADGGYIRNHNPTGRYLYGIDVVVHPDYRHMKVGQHLYKARRDICQKLNLQSIAFGGRMPNYHRYADQMTAEEYVNQVIKQNIYDPVVNFHIKNGFKFKHILKNYIPKDNESLGHATFMEWKNPKYMPKL